MVIDNDNQGWSVMTDSQNIEVIYDSSDPATQWRCHMHTLSKPHTLAMTIGAPILLVIAGMHPLLAVLMVAAPFAIFLLVLSRTIKKRTRAPRLCTTAISPDGLRDTTPDSDKTYTWKDVKNIEYSGGDLYFFVPFSDIFVPRSAFTDTSEAEAFYQNARSLWKQPANLIVDSQTASQIEVQTTPQTEAKLRLADYEAEEEAKWKQYEEDFKKHEEGSTNGSE